MVIKSFKSVYLYLISSNCFFSFSMLSLIYYLSASDVSITTLYPSGSVLFFYSNSSRSFKICSSSSIFFLIILSNSSIDTLLLIIYCIYCLIPWSEVLMFNFIVLIPITFFINSISSSKSAFSYKSLFKLSLLVSKSFYYICKLALVLSIYYW